MDPVYSVAVRSLCEFTARRGDLSARFTPAPTAQQGIAGHGMVASRRPRGYEREIVLRSTYKSLIVRGRADGFDARLNRLEEYKTHRGPADALPTNQRSLHWAQLKIYGALLCAERTLEEIELGLVYFEIASEQETLLLQRFSARDLRAEFEAGCEKFLEWAHQEVQHRERRDRFLDSLTFPFADLQAGQRQVAEAVYRAARRAQVLMVQAPTGIGKTLGTLFPMLKAVPGGKLDRVFFLTAKTAGRALALDALRQLRQPSGGGALRVLELASKESTCRYPGRSCEPQSCPLAVGFYDRLPQVRLSALGADLLDQQAVQRIAAAGGVCPYYLTQELARWCDVIVGDYNYFFDGNSLLHGLIAQNQWRVGLLIDEAHNLLGRARDMYSASLQPAALTAAAAAAPEGAVGAQLESLARAWHHIYRDAAAEYTVHAAPPTVLVEHLRGCTAVIADDAVVEPHPSSGALRQFYFDALHFCRMAEAFSDHSLFDVTRTGDAATLCIRNIVPAPFLAPRFAAVSTTVLFSATLSPAHYYQQLLGLPPTASWLNVAAAFTAEQLEVRIERRISTRYRDRAQSLCPIADLIARQFAAQPGNYLAFFGSFDYAQAAAAVFCQRFPQVPVWEQSRGMAQAEREAFLARFTPLSRGIGFAVLGGAFAEGIDLRGERLIGAFIATLGLPQVNGLNAEIERRMEALFAAGHDYTYLFPGLQKVVQAAGRVIRSPSDRGTVYLIDDRYLSARVQALLPDWWHLKCD